MENVKEFLESSSIIGLSLIANSRRFVLKLFWILVVIGGFAWAFYMIFECFEDWKQKPISTNFNPPTYMYLNVTQIVNSAPTPPSLTAKCRCEL